LTKILTCTTISAFGKYEAICKISNMSTKLVILVYSNTWEPFLFIIKTMAFASKRDIWKFINPLLDVELTILTLAKPLIAIFVIAKKITLVKLTANERDAYKLLY